MFLFLKKKCSPTHTNNLATANVTHIAKYTTASRKPFYSFFFPQTSGQLSFGCV